MSRSTSLSEEILEQALKIVEAGAQRGIALRMMGAAAIATHCGGLDALETSNRALTDIDLVGLSENRRQIDRFFYEMDCRSMMRDFGGELKRRIFISKEDKLHIDVFFDELTMCHTLRLRDRLTIDYPTITLADLLLEKLQIVQINHKDVVDLTNMIRFHEVGDTDHETINIDYIAKVLSRDWGFFYTATENLKLTKDKLLDSLGYLDAEEKTRVSKRIEASLSRIDSEPKTLSWKMRARIGTSKKWYEDVDEIRQDLADGSYA
jgi:hypothetical protein